MGEAVDVVVIGAGVVGLAVGRALALAGREVLIVEQHGAIGTETSSRNSEVIHAGLYYRPGSWRARLCVAGKAMLYDYCRERSIPHLNCGKFVVAEDEAETARLAKLKENAELCGVHDLALISGAEAMREEPGLRCATALWSPSSGIVDSHALMTALLGDFENAGGVLALATPFIGGRIDADGAALRFGGAEATTLNARLVVNCAGLHAEKVARAIDGHVHAVVPRIRPAKGQYFMVAGKAPFRRLIYPLHAPDSLGVHYTRDLGGQGRLGPDIRWDAPLGDYSVDETRRASFAQAARKFWPGLREDQLSPGYAGARPKASGPGEEGDFIFHGAAETGTGRYIGLYAIESPGLTSCLAIGAEVRAMTGGG